jgi:hypothetical protein
MKVGVSYDPKAKWLSSKKPKAQKVRMQKLHVNIMMAAFFLMLKVSLIMNLCQKTRL